MEFLSQQPKAQQEEYFRLLKIMGSLSNLYSESTVPYIYYRGHENAFCKAFSADNLSRSDVSADAGKTGIGIGLKTFLLPNESSLQKIAEFNKESNEIKKHLNTPKLLAQFVSEMRNKRIAMTKAMCGLNTMMYHCVARREHEFLLHEEVMHEIDTKNLHLIKADSKSVKFTDNKNEYSYLYSKSTLFKKFIVTNATPINVSVFDDPFEILADSLDLRLLTSQKKGNSVILPLYSERGEKNVPERSGLNQWNAGGRKRKDREVYIAIPSWIHNVFKNFFPPRDHNFNLHLPNKKTLSAKVCQDNSKALMSNPNVELGEWLIDDVLQVKDNEIVTYEMLLNIGIDSVEITREDHENFRIDFKKVGTYENFREQNKK